MKDIIIDKTGWKKWRFDEVCRQVNVSSKDPKVDGLYYVVGLEHIEPGNLHITKWDTLEKETTFTRKFVKGQVLFGRRRAYQRKVAYAEFDGICSGDILVFEAIEDNLIPELLPFLIQSDGFFEKALATSAGSLSPRTKFKELADYEFLLPPKAEQKRLAELLWAADEMIEKEKKELEKVKISMKCTMQHFFQEKSSLKPIKDFGFVFTGSTPSTKISQYWNGEYPFFTPSEIVDEIKPLHPVRTVTEEGLNVSRKIHIGDVLVTCVGEIGRLSIAEQTCCANQQINVISPYDKDIDSLYLYYNILYHKDIFINISTKSVVPILVKSTFEEILLPDFSIDKKKHFLLILLDIENSLQMIKKQIELSKQLKQESINQIF